MDEPHVVQEKINYETNQYTVINDALIRQCIKLKKVEKEEHDDKKLQALEIKKENMEFHEVEHLEFSFKSKFHENANS
jgi:hypothetical protein